MTRWIWAAVVPVVMWQMLLYAMVVWEFGSIAHPETADWTLAVDGALFGLWLQIGLLLLPVALERGRGMRALVALLMLPSAAVMTGALWEAVRRLLVGHPMAPWVNATYLVGSAAYVGGYVLLSRTKSSPRPPTVRAAL